MTAELNEANSKVDFISRKRDAEKEELIRQTRFLTDKTLELDGVREDLKECRRTCEGLRQTIVKADIRDVDVIELQKGCENASVLKVKIDELEDERERLQKELDIAYWNENPAQTCSSCSELRADIGSMLTMLKEHLHGVNAGGNGFRN